MEQLINTENLVQHDVGLMESMIFKIPWRHNMEVEFALRDINKPGCERV